MFYTQKKGTHAMLIKLFFLEIFINQCSVYLAHDYHLQILIKKNKKQNTIFEEP